MKEILFFENNILQPLAVWEKWEGEIPQKGDSVLLKAEGELAGYYVSFRVISQEYPNKVNVIVKKL